jgi:hypothetical protein
VVVSGRTDGDQSAPSRAANALHAFTRPSSFVKDSNSLTKYLKDKYSCHAVEKGAWEADKEQ